MSIQKKRVTVKPVRPNPLFERWLEEWRQEAATRGSDMQYCFGKALTSLKRYPLPLSSGKECGILNNFGNRLCVMLDRKLAEHRMEHLKDSSPGFAAVNSSPVVWKKSKQIHHEGSNKKISNSHKHQQKSSKSNETKNENFSTKSSPVKRKNTASYVPTLRSGPYALLLTLLASSKKENYTGFMVKAELQKLAQPLCDSSFTKPDPGSRYTAWSSMSTLIKKGLVSTVGRGKYLLTPEGECLALKLRNADDSESQVPTASTDKQKLTLQIRNKNLPSSSITSLQHVSTLNLNAMEKTASTLGGVKNRGKNTENSESVIFTPGSFDVVLLVDTGETSGVGGRKGSNDSALNDLESYNIIFEIRNLKVGDFAWICRERKTKHEVVLPYIIERKRIDDFAQSIMDGRFREQKFRLKQSGIPNLIYIVEKHGKETHTVLPLSSLQQAAVNTQVVDEFIVKYTDNHKHSVSYLAMFTQTLKNLFQMKTLVMCRKNNLPEFNIHENVVSLMSFLEFNRTSMKNKKWTVQDMFIKHLVQLNGVSVEKALAIAERYPTPFTLISEFNQSGDDKLLASIPYSSLGRRIGPVASQALFQLYNNATLS